MLGLGHMSQGIAHEVHPAALPAGLEDLGNGGFEAFVSVGDDELDAFQTALFERAQEAEPEGGSFRWTEAEAENLAPSLGIDAGSDYRGDRHHPAVVTHFEISGVEP